MPTATMTTPSRSDPQPLPGLFDLPDEIDISVDDCEHPCSVCGKLIPYNSTLRDRGWGVSLGCPECYAGERRQGKAAEAITFQTAEDAIREIIPPLFLETDPSLLPYKERQLVLEWEAKEKAKGLWLVGDTRRGKTRCLCLLVKRLITEGKKVRAFFQGAFADELLEVIRSEKSFRAWKYGITRAEILVIDDLFAFKMTERVETAIFEIIDERISFHRPTLVTTQLTAKAASDRFHSAQRHAAFFARIEEFFKVIPFKRDEQAALGVGR